MDQAPLLRVRTSVKLQSGRPREVVDPEPAVAPLGVHGVTPEGMY